MSHAYFSRRIRRVKCDEGRPACHRCTSTGRKCDGYSSLPFSRRELHTASQSLSRSEGYNGISISAAVGALPKLITDATFSDVLEKRYFQFFRTCTVTSTNSLLDCRFWDRLVLQVCYAEPAVKHAVLALSSLHQLYEVQGRIAEEKQHLEYATKQYNTALAHARDLVSRANDSNVQAILVACLIFICYENVRGNHKASQVHLQSGRSILNQRWETLSKQSKRSSDAREIARLFARLDLSAMTFSSSRSPYQHYVCPYYDIENNLPEHAFKDVSEARAPLIDHVRWWIYLLNQLSEASTNGNLAALARINADVEKCKGRLAHWRVCFEDAAERAPASSRLMIATLRLWHDLADLLIDAGFYGSESRFDGLLPRFETMLRHGAEIIEAESGSFSLELGTTMPLFVVASRCRDPTIRRRAIGLLRAKPKRESVWSSVGAAAIAERIMTIEEQGLGEVRTAADVPDENRVQASSMVVNSEQSEIELSLSMFQPFGGKGWTLRQEWVEYT